MKKMTTKRALIIVAIFAIVVFFVVIKLVSSDEDVSYSTVQAVSENILQTVSETGTIKAKEEIDLSFLNTGKLNKIHVSVGDKVLSGQVLAELDYGSLEIRKNEAEASLEVAERNLQKLISGATREEIAIEQASTDQARASYESAKREYDRADAALSEAAKQAEKTLSDLEKSTSYDITTCEQAIETAKDDLEDTKTLYEKGINDEKSDSLFLIDNKSKVANTALDKIDTIITDDDAKDLISKKKPEYLTQTKAEKEESLVLLSELESRYELLSYESSAEEIGKVLSDTKVALNLVFSALSNCFSALENSVTSGSFTSTELDTMKTTISTQQSAIATAVTALDTQIQALDSALLSYQTKVSAAENALLTAETAYDNALLNAKNSLSSAELNRNQQLTLAQSKIDSSYELWQVAEARLARIIAPANPHDVALYRANIKQARASLDSINRQIEDSIIKSKIDGVVTDIKFEAGEQVLTGSPAITVLGENKFDIEVLVSEADIAKVEIADKVEITLDAYSDDDVMWGEIIFVEPAETVIQDVIYYKVEISFDPGEISVKSGMTANVTITTAEKANVITVPSRAIIDRNGSGKFVRLLIDKQIQESKVVTGLRGDGGVVEILDGVKAGDQVVTSIKEKK